MCRRIWDRCLLKQEKGISLVEVLTTLAIVGIFSLVIVGYMVSGMNSYNKVNDEIALHDEANYVMMQFINSIYQATRVEVVEQNENNSIIKVKNYEGEVTTLGFKNNQAIINDTAIHPDKYIFLNDSKITIKGEKTVMINLSIKNKLSGQNLELESAVSYLK